MSRSPIIVAGFSFLNYRFSFRVSRFPFLVSVYISIYRSSFLVFVYRLTFTIYGHDEGQQIVKGVHERSVVRLDEFLADARGSQQAR